MEKHSQKKQFTMFIHIQENIVKLSILVNIFTDLSPHLYL